MGKVIAGMTMSLDGFINAEKVNPDFDELRKAPSFKAMIENTGAAVMGRHVYEMADPFMWANDDYEFQTPLFVLTHTPPDKYPPGNGKLSFTFITDGLTSAIARAKEAAGDKDVQVIGGADTIQQCLSDGLCDELQIDITSVLLGDGLRLFENIDTGKISLERIKVEQPTASRTSITFRVTKL
jgi:dihydrofolate reductase